MPKENLIKLGIYTRVDYIWWSDITKKTYFSEAELDKDVKRFQRKDKLKKLSINAK